MAFSVLPGISPPPSLHNIYKELLSDIPTFIIPNHGYLKKWAIEGVLLLNIILTVEKGKSFSHSNIGWEKFTNQVIHLLNVYHKKIVFLLWGKYAQKLGNIINYKKHYILTASHPSPMSAKNGFFGCQHFSKTNFLLKNSNKLPINWHIPNY